MVFISNCNLHCASFHKNKSLILKSWRVCSYLIFQPPYFFGFQIFSVAKFIRHPIVSVANYSGYQIFQSTILLPPNFSQNLIGP